MIKTVQDQEGKRGDILLCIAFWGKSGYKTLNVMIDWDSGYLNVSCAYPCKVPPSQGLHIPAFP